MGDITTSARFKSYAGITGTGQDTLIASLITEVSAQIERYLRRTLTTTTYKAWYDGTGGPILRLNQYPITALYQVSVGSKSVATVENTSSTVEKAVVSFDGTNLVLTEISTSGTETISELPVATSKIISTLKTAIEAKTGWGCDLLSADYGTMPTSMLRPIYGQDAVSPSTADIVVPDDPVPVKIVHEDAIEIINADIFPNWDSFPTGSQYPRTLGGVMPGITNPTFSHGFPPGTANIFVWFKAGYTMPTAESDGTLPGGLLLVAHGIINDVLSSTKINSNLQSESIGDYSYSLRSGEGGAAIISAIKNRAKELNMYRRVSI